jgi:hypothetical protein
MEHKMLNKKTTSASIILIALAISGIFFFTRSRNASANVVPVPDAPEVRISTESLSSNDSLTPSPKTSQMVIEFISKWRSRIINGAEGWLHLVYQIDSEVDNGVVLPDGDPMPSSYVEDGWYFINKHGLVEKDVVTIKDPDGNILQQSAFNGNLGINFTLGFKDENLVPYEIKLDRGFIQSLLDAEALGILVNYQDISYKDKPSKEFSYTETYDNPVQIGGGQEPVESTYLSGIFTNETGEMVSYRKVLTYISGKEVLFEENSLLIAEFLTDAPSEILLLLESVK